MFHAIRFTTALILAATSLIAMGEERTLYSFQNPTTQQRWQSVNDGVMGGRSTGKSTIQSNGTMQFTGRLSLENNGGFASIRTQGTKLGLKIDDVIIVRGQGDGRQYNFNLYSPRNSGGYSFRQAFQTKQGEWLDIELPVNKFVATRRGRKYPDKILNPAEVTGMGIQLGDGMPGTFKLEVNWIKAVDKTDLTTLFKLNCPGVYPHHLQGICADNDAIYWCFTTTLVKTDKQGKLLRKVPVANHHGDLCHHAGKLYVAVNLGNFNDPKGNAQSWVYVYDASTLNELARHEVPDVFHGAGGIGFHDGHFFVVGGLPNDIDKNYVYEYDPNFELVKKHVIKSGHTHLGIQTATFANGRWWFGCYGTPKITLVTDPRFKMIGHHEKDCSLGIEQFTDGRLLVASGSCDSNQGCTGNIRSAMPDKSSGFLLQD